MERRNRKEVKFLIVLSNKKTKYAFGYGACLKETNSNKKTVLK